MTNKPRLQYAICVSGAASGDTVADSIHLAERLGKAIAKRGHITITGATVGLPYYAAKGAMENGGTSIGFSPAASIRDHLRRYRLPVNYFDFINYTGMNYVGRDVHLVQSADAVITIGGRFGSMHEFVTALELKTPCGVLTGSNGTADTIQTLLKVIENPKGTDVIFDDNPENLIARIIDNLDIAYKDIAKELEKDEHWYLGKNDTHRG